MKKRIAFAMVLCLSTAWAWAEQVVVETRNTSMVLEVEKGTWTEAIFAKTKEPVLKIRCNGDVRYDEDGNIINNTEEDSESDDKSVENEDDMGNDDTFYSSYAAEAEVKEEPEDGFSIEE